MKNQFYFVFILLFAMALVTCSLDGKGGDDDDDDPLTLDQRLVGGRWYQIIVVSENSKYDLIYKNLDESGWYFYSECYYEFRKAGDKSYFFLTAKK